MRNRKSWLLSVLAFGSILQGSLVLASDRVSYTAYVLDGASRREVFRGERQYSARDVKTEAKAAKDGSRFWSKSITLEKGFFLGAHVDHDATKSGFGLWLRNEKMLCRVSG